MPASLLAGYAALDALVAVCVSVAVYCVIAIRLVKFALSVIIGLMFFNLLFDGFALSALPASFALGLILAAVALVFGLATVSYAAWLQQRAEGIESARGGWVPALLIISAGILTFVTQAPLLAAVSSTWGLQAEVMVGSALIALVEVVKLVTRRRARISQERGLADVSSMSNLEAASRPIPGNT
jgi:hypothetical protein